MALSLALAGCAGTRQTQTGIGGPSEVDIHQGKKGNEKVTQFDTNHDLKPDVWEYSVPGKDAEGKPVDRRVRQELDLNWDGRVDVVYEYDDKGRVNRASFDFDYDGKVDQVNFSENGVLVRKERSLGHNGHVDEWVFYGQNKVIRRERDVNGDGRVDYWEYWENDQVDRIGEDIDGDGKVDRWTKNTRSES